MSRRRAPESPCWWHDCSKPATARVRFALPNLLAGSQRDYCQQHTDLVCVAPGTRVVRRLGPRQPVQPSLLGLEGAKPPLPTPTGTISAKAGR